MPKLVKNEFKHCNRLLKAQELYTLPAISVRMESCKWLELALVNCNRCKKLVVFWRKLNDEGHPSSEWMQSSPKNAINWLSKAGVAGQRFIPQGAQWVWGSRQSFPYNKRRVAIT